MAKNVIHINESDIRNIVAENLKRIIKEISENGFEISFLEFLDYHKHCIGDPCVRSAEEAANWFKIYEYMMNKWNHFKQSWEKEGYNIENYLEYEFLGHDDDDDSEEQRYDDDAITNGTYPA